MKCDNKYQWHTLINDVCADLWSTIRQNMIKISRSFGNRNKAIFIMTLLRQLKNKAAIHADILISTFKFLASNYTNISTSTRQRLDLDRYCKLSGPNDVGLVITLYSVKRNFWMGWWLKVGFSDSESLARTQCVGRTLWCVDCIYFTIIGLCGTCIFVSRTFYI